MLLVPVAARRLGRPGLLGLERSSLPGLAALAARQTALPVLGVQTGGQSGASGSSSSSSSAGHKQTRPPRSPPPPPFPTVASCPEPTCACVPMPEMPPGLPIDRKGRLNGLIAAYNEQVLVCTGQDDWPSRIEDDHAGDNLAADLKELFGRGGVYSDPFHHVAVVNASFPSSVPVHRTELQTSSVYLLPSFRYVPYLPRVSFDSVDALAKAYLLPAQLHPAHDGRLSPVHRDRLTRHAAYRRLLWGVQDSIPDILVLICGHGGRDARCGVLGPVLRTAFEQALERVGVRVQHGPVEISQEEAEARQQLLLGPSAEGDGDAAAGPEANAADDEAARVLSNAATSPGGLALSASSPKTARVGLISHIGGHKFAGNVIVYLPPSLRTVDGTGTHPLAGYGVWYGRIDPQHVEGLVQETILKGNVVTNHFRGAINHKREIVRL